MRGSWWSWSEPPRVSGGKSESSQLEMLSFNIDPQWCGLLFSIYCRHEKGGSLISGGQADSFAYSIAGPPLDADLIAWAGSFGFEICSLSSTCDLIFESVKATGVLILLGFSGLICYKVLNVCWPRSWSSLSPKRRDRAPPTILDNREDNELEEIKGEYFGPSVLKEESNNDSSKQYQNLDSFSASSSPINGCGTSGDDADESDGSPCVKLTPVRHHRSRRNQAKAWLPSPMSSADGSRLPRDESFDSLGFTRHMHRDGSFDSTCSELSFDFSLPEIASDTNTIISLDKLQQEIDSLKSNCLRMDEEFETIKCNRNFPGMSSLMKANTSQSSLGSHNMPLDAVASDNLKQEKARACFAGLYSLTTIKSSTSSELSDSFPARGSLGSAESLDWDSPKTVASPAKSVAAPDESCIVKFGLSELAEDFEPESVLESTETDKLETRISNPESARLLRQNSDRNRSLAGSEDELMENLEWDEEDIQNEYPEENGTLNGTLLSVVEPFEVEASNGNCVDHRTSMSRSWTASPPLERSPSRLESSGFGSQMLASDWDNQGACWSSEESGYMDWERNQNVQTLWCDSQNSSELSTPANENAPISPQPNIGPRVNILQYAAKEWQGHTSNAQTMLKGYAAIPELLNLEYLRGIRGDNYCGIRAALFQTLAQGLPLPSGSSAFQYLSAATNRQGFHWLKDWSFANRLPYQGNRVMEGMEQCLRNFDHTVALLAPVDTSERQETLAQLLNCDPNLDLHLVEAVKLLMLQQAMELHQSANSAAADDLPLFAILMFARDTSETPRDFMNNHLHQVGNTGGLEQVEMFLLGYTLGVTLRVVRPKAFNTDDFVCCYPDWNVGIWPQVVLIAEDDRHYNVLVN